MSQASLPPIYDQAHISQMSNLDILDAVRDMESTYREHATSAANDHRRHLDRKDLENIFRLTCRAMEFRRIDRMSTVDSHSHVATRGVTR